jgi:CBS domain-containing protein
MSKSSGSGIIFSAYAREDGQNGLRPTAGVHTLLNNLKPVSVLTAMKSCGEHVSNEAARYFVQELRKARLDALANAEGWRPFVLILERLAKLLKNDQRTTLGQAKDCLVALACAGETTGSTCQPLATPTAVLVQLVVDGRNEEFHGGSAARRFVHHCVELSILLEDALKMKIDAKLENVMSPNPTCVETWQPVSYARRLMLENSFTWLPFRANDKWHCVSDHALVAFVHGDRARLGKSLDEATNGEPKLSVQVLATKDASIHIDGEVINLLSKGPLLVTSGTEKHVVGIVTAFDLL